MFPLLNRNREIFLVVWPQFLEPLLPITIPLASPKIPSDIPRFLGKSCRAALLSFFLLVIPSTAVSRPAYLVLSADLAPNLIIASWDEPELQKLTPQQATSRQ